MYQHRARTIRPLLGSTAGAALAAAAAIHGLWATGSTWPAASTDELADLVVGRRPMPGPAACAVVAGALAVAAATTTLASTGTRAGSAPRTRAAATVVSAALLARGIAGAVTDVCHIGEQTPEFRRWNRRLYNPLCVTLGVLAAAGRPSRP
jgi:hypothetical protein